MTAQKETWIISRRLRKGGWSGEHISTSREDAVDWMNNSGIHNLRAWNEETGTVIMKGQS